MKIIFTMLIVVAAAFGQTANKPVQQAGKPPRVTIPPNYYANQLHFLESNGSAPPPPTVGTAKVVRIAAPAAKSAVIAPEPLNSPAVSAVSIGKQYKDAPGLPVAPDAMGRAVFSYGAGLPTLVCAPLRLCNVELEAGEKIQGEPQLGDAVRWQGSLVYFGHGENATPVVTLKPVAAGLDTNLLVTTDRRAYYVRLVSHATDYIARLAFAYPEEAVERARLVAAEHEAEIVQEKRRAAVEAAKVPTAASTSPDISKLCFGYAIKGGNRYNTPTRVFDDTKKTYIQMAAAISSRELPVLMVLGTDGKGQMTNYRVQNNTFIVDSLFDRAELLSGGGKKAKKDKVKITRER